MKLKPRHVFIALSVSFLIFTIGLYLKPFDVKKHKHIDYKKASEGRLVLQKYNCQSCHQFYGLGGYLGPDLTNVYSKYNKNEKLIKALMKGGFKQMPSFKLSENEENLLVEFLKSTDASGSSDPRDFKMLNDGMIEQNDNRK